MHRLLILFSFVSLLACGGSSSNETTATYTRPGDKSESSGNADNQASSKGIGEVKHVDLNDPLNPDMVSQGEAIYQLKCAACHKLTDQRVVGPGWKGITSKRTPEWIMNMTLNVDVMLAEDPAAQELLKQCLVRMPNQNLSMDDARDVLEFMYKNDGTTVATN